jgi:glycine/D-amino acid oxidase-like deaminating enzyme
MNLRSGQSYWPLKNGLISSFPSLNHNLKCEVVVLGAGITGALVAYYFGRAGVETVVLDTRDVGMGSTAASTAMLLYATDTELIDLIPAIGEQDAVRCYELGREAIAKIDAITRGLEIESGFQSRQSLYLASEPSHVDRLKREYDVRRQHGFTVEFLDAAAIAQRFPFGAPAGLLCSGDGEIDAYRFTHGLLRDAGRHGVRIHDRTRVAEIEQTEDGVIVTTETGASVQARRVIFATGYESQQYVKQKIGSLHSTFALVTEPVEPFPNWPGRCMIWETSRPYTYFRSTDDNRVIVGGEDVPFATAHRQDSLIEEKTMVLKQKLDANFPDAAFEIAYAWGGTFGSTEDGLAYIGQTPEWRHGYFALGYGGNGITLSLVAAEMILDHYLGRENTDAHIFRFDR